MVPPSWTRRIRGDHWDVADRSDHWGGDVLGVLARLFNTKPLQGWRITARPNFRGDNFQLGLGTSFVTRL